jgi:hypothetical protein
MYNIGLWNLMFFIFLLFFIDYSLTSIVFVA